MDINQSIEQRCFHNENGTCHYLESALVNCDGLCNMFLSFNKKLCRKVGKTPVDRYEYEKTIRRKNV